MNWEKLLNTNISRRKALRLATASAAAGFLTLTDKNQLLHPGETSQAAQEQVDYDEFLRIFDDKYNAYKKNYPSSYSRSGRIFDGYTLLENNGDRLSLSKQQIIDRSGETTVIRSIQLDTSELIQLGANEIPKKVLYFSDHQTEIYFFYEGRKPYKFPLEVYYNDSDIPLDAFGLEKLSKVESVTDPELSIMQKMILDAKPIPNMPVGRGHFPRPQEA